MMSDREGWHLDKRIPLALIGIILLQTGVFGTWVGAISARVAAVEAWQVSNQKIDTRLAVLENQNTEIRRTLDAIEITLRRLWDRRAGRPDEPAP
jgi:hypothetical protein